MSITADLLQTLGFRHATDFLSEVWVYDEPFFCVRIGEHKDREGLEIHFTAQDHTPAQLLARMFEEQRDRCDEDRRRASVD